jgi:hypothetical protein
MAVVVSPTYSTQAVAGRHDIIEGRGVQYTEKGTFHDDLHQVEYAKHKVPGTVWVAICPPDNFPVPIPDELLVATYKSTFNIKDINLYTDPILTGTDYLIHPSEQNYPTLVAKHSLVALYKGIIGITPECYTANKSETLIPGTQLVMSSNGIFTHRELNDPANLVVGHVEYYQKSTGMLYIHVF